MTIRYKLKKNCSVLARKQPDVFGSVRKVVNLELDGIEEYKVMGLFFKRSGSCIFIFDIPYRDEIYGVLLDGEKFRILREQQFMYFCRKVQGIRDKIYNNK